MSSEIPSRHRGVRYERKRYEYKVPPAGPGGRAGRRRPDARRRSDRVRIAGLGLEFDNLSMAGAVQRIDRLVRARYPAMVVTANVDHALRFQHDPEYARIVRGADLVLADGKPIIWASRLQRTPLKERVTGSDLLPLLCRHAARCGQRVFLLGGDPGVADKARSVLEARFPGLQVVGTHCPPTGFEKSAVENARAVEAVRQARPDILFVGLGSPKQERWIARNMFDYGPCLSIGVGISLSFVAGVVRRAPLWMRKAGLEWFWRLLCEPRRLWKRYLIQDLPFLGVLFQAWRQRKVRPPGALSVPPAWPLDGAGLLDQPQ
jgi:N-acetylglucosaminyldiphosphoundecaprenol N-acetyl-beta-D-mannosaminyltransferase